MNELLDFVVPRVIEAMKELLEKYYVAEEVKQTLLLVFTRDSGIFWVMMSLKLYWSF